MVQLGTIGLKFTNRRKEMKYIIVIGLAIIGASLSFMAWTYIYNGVFGFFITPNDPITSSDNYARFGQIVGGIILGAFAGAFGMDIVGKK